MYKRSFGSRIKQYSLMILPIIGILIISAVLVLVWFWNQMGREMFYYTDVVMLKEDVKRGTVIQSNMLEHRSVEKDNVIEAGITDVEQIVGLAAKHYIPAGTQLHPFYFEDSDVVTKDEEFVFQIPQDWIYSIPQSLRRLDRVVLYEVTNVQEKQEKEVKPNVARDEKGDESQALITHNAAEEEEWKQILGKPLLQTKVAYVKDSANREVRTLSKTPRLDGSSRIAEVEVVASVDDIKKMEAAVKEGSQFIIMYSEGE